MKSYINIALEPGDAFIDFHFYSFNLGKIDEIGRYYFKQLDGAFEYALPDDADIEDGGTEHGKIECSFLDKPFVGWYKGEPNKDIYRFASLMEACVFNQNIDEVRTNAAVGPKFFPHFVGIYMNAKVKNIDDEIVRSWPTKGLANIDLFNYCQYDKINSKVADEEKLHPGMAVYFNNFEFNTSIDGDKKVFAMNSDFKVLALDMFMPSTDRENNNSSPAGKSF